MATTHTIQLINSITIGDILTMQALGVNFHTYRLPTSPHKVRAYINNIDKLTPTLIDMAKLSSTTKKLLHWHVDNGSAVASLI